jgi:hypothetical protein
LTEQKNLKRLIRERQAHTGESYTTARRHLTGDQPAVAAPDNDAALGALLALVDHPGPRFQSIQATYRVWHDDVLLREARHADVEALRASGRSIMSYSSTTGEPGPAETEELVRFWRQDDGFRYEIHGGHQDGLLDVAANGVWWWWQPGMGGRSNEEDPSVPNPVKELPFVLDPERLLGLVEFEATGRSEVAGRATISARATRLSPKPNSPMMTLYSLGSGADRYELELDSERGVLLNVSAIYNGQVIKTITAQTIEFDATIPLAVFTFELPEGEGMRPLRRTPPE